MPDVSASVTGGMAGGWIMVATSWHSFSGRQLQMLPGGGSVGGTGQLPTWCA